jgi:hypothetical protein
MGASGLPPVSPDEAAILAPLSLDDEDIQAAEGDALVEMGLALGIARGYAMCRCATTPSRPPDSVDDLAGCASWEAGPFSTLVRESMLGPARADEDGLRCVKEALALDSTLEASMRCLARSIRDDGRAWLEQCSRASPEPTVPRLPAPCSSGEGLQMVLVTCDFAVYCSDGTRKSGKRCDASRECEDWSDELGCFEISGRDIVRCGDTLDRAEYFCQRTECGYMTEPPLCDEEHRDRFLCADGSDVGHEAVCDRKADCADATDERFCLTQAP